MNSSASYDVFVKRAASVMVWLLAIHIGLCLYFIVTPKHYPFHRTVIGSLYNKVFLIGPFYTEERISISPNVYIRHKDRGGEWSSFFNYGASLHGDYYTSPWRYDILKQDDLMRHFMREAFNTKWKHSHDPREASNTKQFCTLNTFIAKELIHKEDLDSVNLVYIFSSFSKENATFRVDTLWNITFSPHHVCAVQ